jgi:hypothetical protein
MATRENNQLLENVRRGEEVVVGPGGVIRSASEPKAKPSETNGREQPTEARPVKAVAFGAR